MSGRHAALYTRYVPLTHVWEHDYITLSCILEQGPTPEPESKYPYNHYASYHGQTVPIQLGC